MFTPLLLAQAIALATSEPMPANAQPTTTVVFGCRVSDEMSPGIVPTGGHDMLARVRDYVGADGRASFEIELHDPDSVITAGPIMQRGVRTYGTDGVNIILSNEGWPAQGQAIGIRSKTPKVMDGIHQIYDAVILSNAQILRQGICVQFDGELANQLFEQRNAIGTPVQ